MDAELFTTYGEDFQSKKTNSKVYVYLILLQVGTPNPSQINPWSGTRFGGGNDIQLVRATTNQSTAMSIATSFEDCIKPLILIHEL